MLTRRRLLASSLAAPLTAAPAGRPNILFVIADDQSYPHASAYGDKVVKTPAFDRIAREGALFTNSYCASPSCTPSRSAVLTGRHQYQVGEAGVLYGTMPTKYPLYPHILEDAGYHVGATGKGWSPGDYKAAGLTREPTGKLYNACKHPGPVRVGINPIDYAANFDDFLKARPHENGKPAPFCFWLGSTEPHRIFEKGAGARLGLRAADVTVPAYWPDTPEIRNDILDYYSEIDWYDRQLARTLEILEKTGELDNTLIIVTSDNGMAFPRSKVNLYDRGVHMPLAIRWPAGFRGGRTIAEFVSHTDFAPTILEAAGIKPPAGITGRSLLPLLAGKPDPSRDHVITSFERHTIARPDFLGYPMRSIRTARYIYIRNFAPERWPTGGEFVSSNKTLHGDIDASPSKDFVLENRDRFPKQYDLCIGKRPAEEFYDLEKDPDQLHNITAHPELTRMRAQLEAYLKKTGDPRIEGKDPWQSYPYRSQAIQNSAK